MTSANSYDRRPSPAPADPDASQIDRRQTEGTGPAVRRSFRTGILWSLVGGLLGAVPGVAAGLWLFADDGSEFAVFICAVVGFLAGSSVGFALGAGRSDDEAADGLSPQDERREERAAFGGGSDGRAHDRPA
jgi:hypothetical protein